jgi:hypothetical protein
MRLSEQALISPIDLLNAVAGEPFAADVGGTNGQTGYENMKNYSRVMAYVEIGTWNATDDLDECRLQQASAAAGTGVKDLTTDAAAGNYDTDNPVDADGDFVLIEARAENLDIDASFEHVRFYIAEASNTGVDTANGYMVLYGFAYPQAQVQGAAVTGENVYVEPS